MKTWKIESGDLDAEIKAPTIQYAMEKLSKWEGNLGVLLRYRAEGIPWRYWDTKEAFKSKRGAR